MKRITSAFLALLMVFSVVIPVSSASAQSSTQTVETSAVENTNQGDGVIFKKMSTPHLVNGIPDGSIDITLEAYTTGTVTNTVTVIPTDIILVLDMSGSMTTTQTTEAVYEYTAANGTTFTESYWTLSGGTQTRTVHGFDEDSEMYIKNGDNYIRVYRSGRDSNNFYYYYSGSFFNRTYYYPTLASDPSGVNRTESYSVVQFYERSVVQQSTSKTRIQLLKEAVDAFISETHKANEGLATEDMHRISLIKFADDSYYNGSGMTSNIDEAVVGDNRQGGTNNYNYSQIVKKLTPVDDSGLTELTTAMDALQPAGATSVDFGLALAKKEFDENTGKTDTHRKKVLIVFTDGEPNHSSGYDSDVAAAAVNSTLAMKNSGVTVFTVCVDDNASASNATTQLNKFMHYLSSNFPNAYANANDTLMSGLASGETEAAAIAKGFYQTPDQTHGLKGIFESIAATIETPTIELGENATVIDTVSTSFTIPEGTSGIKVYTSEKTASDWDTPVAAGSEIQISLQNDRTLQISGFDFDSNYVSSDARDGFYGKKLIITFNVAPNPDAIDADAANIAANGGLISTNLGTAKLTDSSLIAVAEVASPTIKAHKVTYTVDGAVYKTTYRLAGQTSALTPAPADTAALDYGEWTSSDVTLTGGSFTMPEKDITISLTGTRKSYNVTYRIEGSIPSGATVTVPAQATYANGTEVDVAAGYTVQGYVFSGWSTANAVVSGGKFTMPANNVEFVGSFSAGDVSYSVEHYLMGTDGTYPATPATTHAHTGKTGETVSAHLDIEYPNFVLDTSAAGTVLSGTVKADGSLVLKLYYKRNTHTVKYEYVGTAPTGAASALPAESTHYYNENVSIAPVPAIAGYTFVGWATDGGDAVITEGASGKYFVMPARDVTLKGSFVANENTVYTVEHYLEGDGGVYAYRESTTHTGKTGDTATALPGNYPSYSHNSGHPEAVLHGTIAGDGSLVLKVYYDRDPYTVTYTLTGTYPAEATALIPTAKSYEWGSIVTRENNISVDGWVFAGWTTTDASVDASGNFTMPAHNVTFVGNFDRESAKYKIEHYLMDANGNYPATPTATYERTADVGDSVTAEWYSPLTAFTHDTARSNISGTVVSNKNGGELVLKLYYQRNQYDVEYVYTTAAPTGAPALPQKQTYYVGATVTLAAIPSLPGYIFNGWITSDAAVDTNRQFVMPVGNVTVNGHFEAGTGTKYAVEHYVEVEGGYNLRITTSHAGTTGETATALPQDFHGYTYNDANTLNVKSGTIAGDGSLVLKLYYERNSYKVTYKFSGTLVPPTAVLPTEKTYEWGTSVDLEAGYDITGYIFTGWTSADVIPTGNSFTMPDKDVTFIGSFVKHTASYKVEHYLMDEYGNYPATATNSHSHSGAQVGTTVSADTAYTYPHFTYDSTAANVVSGTVEENGTLTLKLYFARNKYTVTYVYENSPIPTGAPALPAVKEYFYNAKVNLEAKPTLAGYEFIGWATDGADAFIENGTYFAMPGRNVIVHGTFNANTGTIYKVEHYFEGTGGNYDLRKTTSHVGTTDTTAYAIPATEVGYSHNPSHPNAKESGTIAGDGSLVLRVYYDKLPYRVHYSITGDMPTGATTPAVEIHDYSNIVTVATPTAISGYKFIGWTTDDVTVINGSFAMPSHDVYLVGYYVPTVAPYRVEHYLMDTNGSYPSVTTHFATITDDIGKTVSAEYRSFTGFTADTAYTGTKISGEISADGTLVLKLYYSRNKYKVSYEYTERVPAGAASSLPATKTHYYGEEVGVAGLPLVPGYTFFGWSSNEVNVVGTTFDMPNGDVTFKGYFVAGPSKYTVEHYKEKLDGTFPQTPDESEVFASNVKVDDYVTAAFKQFTGFTPKSNNVFSGTVTPEPDTLTIKLYYTRNTYKVDYEYAGLQPDGAPDINTNDIATVKYGESVQLAAIPTLKYHTFEGWFTSTADIAGGSFTMPAHNVLINGSFRQTTFEYTVRYYLNGTLYDSYKVYTGETHSIIADPAYGLHQIYSGWSAPVNAVTGTPVTVTGGSFVMPDANVDIYATITNIPVVVVTTGTLKVEKVLDAPAGFTMDTFEFELWEKTASDMEYVKDITVKAGTSCEITLPAGVYAVYEKACDADGYSRVTTCSSADNTVRVKVGEESGITFTNRYYKTILDTVDHFAYIVGYPDGLVRPEAYITRAEVATVFFRMLTDSARSLYFTSENSYTDVSDSDWFNKAVSTLAKAGVLTGYEDGSFRPNEYITRAELVKIATTFYGTHAGQNTHFSDVSGHWAEDFVAEAENLGFIDGYEDGSFRPDANITRAEAIRVINRTLRRIPDADHLLENMTVWADNTDKSKWYYADIQEATNSHTYTFDSFGYEVWKSLLPARDWTELEKAE